jgi:hypothetical protein
MFKHMGTLMAGVASMMANRIYGAENIARHIRDYGHTRSHARIARTSIATANRWTGKPHEHKREIARRLRQAA